MADGKYEILEVRIDVSHPELTRFYVRLKGDAQCPMGVTGWHGEAFPGSIPAIDIYAKEIGNAVMWPLRAPPGEVQPTVYVTGFYPVLESGEPWSIVGIYNDEADAKAMCRDRRYFVGPVPVDVELSKISKEWIGCYYPNDAAPTVQPLNGGW